MYTHPAQELDGGRWAEHNPSKCPCRGGWLLSDWDSWHRCPLHGKGLPHPEECDNEGGRPEFDYEAHTLHINRQAYVHFLNEAIRAGMTRESFKAAVTDAVAPTGTPAEWVNAADAVAEEAWRMEANARAQAQGFSCRLEAAWAAEGAFERACRDQRVEPETEAYGPLAVDRDSWYRN